MKIYYVLLLVAVAFTACSPENGVEPTKTQPPVSYRLKKISTGNVERVFSYEGKALAHEQWRNEQGIETDRITLEHDQQGHLTSYTRVFLQPSVPWEIGTRLDYLYDENGRLSVIRAYSLKTGQTPEAPDLRLSSIDSLTYSGTGQVVGSRQYSYRLQGSSFSKDPVQRTQATYQYDAKGNLIEEVSITSPVVNWGGTSSARKIVRQYDDKENPYHLINCPVFGKEGWSRNNVLKETSYFVYLYSPSEQPNFAQATPSATDYSYTYKNNLPQQKTSFNSEIYEYESY